MATASDLMNPTPLTAGPEQSVYDVVRKLHEVSADAACVIEDDRLLGIVTSRHLGLAAGLAERLLARERPDVPVHDLVELVEPVAPDTPADEVLAALYEASPGAVPVMDGGVLRGLVSRKSVVAALAGEPLHSRVIK